MTWIGLCLNAIDPVSENHMLVNLADIIVPPKWRKLEKKAVAGMTDSFRLHGQLQPIGLRTDPDQPGLNVLVFGRHRLEAAQKLGWESIDATVLDFGSQEDADGATAAENIFRANLKPAERLLMVKTYYDRYLKVFPNSEAIVTRQRANLKQNKAKAVADAEAAVDPPAPTFAERLAAMSGVGLRQAQILIASAKALTEEQIGVLAESGVSVKDIEKIAAFEPDAITKVVSLIASGMEPSLAISHVHLPPNATFTQVGDHATAKPPAVASDEDWLKSECGEVLAKLKYKLLFEKDAILYRRTLDMRVDLRARSKRILKQSSAQNVGAFQLLFMKFVNVDHPSTWQPCAPCGGSGAAEKGKCGSCYGHGYTIKSTGGAKK